MRRCRASAINYNLPAYENRSEQNEKERFMMETMESQFAGWLKNVGLGAFQRIITAVLILAVGIFLTRLITNLVRKALQRSRLERAAHSMIISVVRVALYLLVFINVASSLGVDMTGVVAMASVLTLAVSLALQNMLANVMGGFTILTTHPFHSGDYVDIGGQSGTVEEISMTYTRLATPDNKIVSIPNNTVIASQITNYSVAGKRRVDISISAAYSMATQDVVDALIQAGTVEKVLPDPAPFAAVTGYGESTIQYTLRVWVKSEDYWDVFFRINQRIQRIFAENRIEMSYPHLNVHLDR